MATRKTPRRKRPKAPEAPSESLGLGEALGASEETSEQMLALFIPSKDEDGREFGTQRKWVLEAAELLVQMGGGVTILPPAEGGWLNEAEGEIVWEHPVLVYSYIKPDRFLPRISQLRSLVHRMGRQTNQGEVVVEFGGIFLRIKKPFDEA